MKNSWNHLHPLFKMVIFDLFCPCPAIFGDLFSEENSRNYLNNWKKILPVILFMLPCCVVNSPSLIVCGCNSSPTGAVILILYFWSCVQRSNLAGCVVSLKFIENTTVVVAPFPKESVRIASQTCKKCWL